MKHFYSFFFPVENCSWCIPDTSLTVNVRKCKNKQSIIMGRLASNSHMLHSSLTAETYLLVQVQEGCKIAVTVIENYRVSIFEEIFPVPNDKQNEIKVTAICIGHSSEVLGLLLERINGNTRVVINIQLCAIHRALKRMTLSFCGFSLLYENDLKGIVKMLEPSYYSYQPTISRQLDKKLKKGAVVAGQIRWI